MSGIAAEINSIGSLVHHLFHCLSGHELCPGENFRYQDVRPILPRNAESQIFSWLPLSLKPRLSPLAIPRAILTGPTRRAESLKLISNQASPVNFCLLEGHQPCTMFLRDPASTEATGRSAHDAGDSYAFHSGCIYWPSLRCWASSRRRKNCFYSRRKPTSGLFSRPKNERPRIAQSGAVLLGVLATVDKDRLLRPPRKILKEVERYTEEKAEAKKEAEALKLRNDC